MVHTEPNVRSALMNVVNSCCCNEIEVTENGKKINEKLGRLINIHYKRFFRTAIVNAIATGFVCFTIKRVEGVAMPECLPLGSFEWTVNFGQRLKKNMREKQGLVAYEVQHSIPGLSEQQIYIFPFEDPVCVQPVLQLPTPMYGLMMKYRDMLNAVEASIRGNTWNSSKHLVFSERIDLKDQTVSGLQLLDEQRRYHLTGSHQNMFNQNFLRLQDRDGYWKKSVQEGIHHHINDQFTDNSMGVGSGSKRACCHIMPPNIDVQELGPVSTISDVDAVQQRFATDVQAFFNLNTQVLSQSKGSNASVEAMNEDQYRQHKQMCVFLEHLSQYVYSKCFGVDENTIEFTVQPVSKQDLSDPENVKKLADAEVLSEGNKMHMKKKLKISQEQNRPD